MDVLPKPELLGVGRGLSVSVRKLEGRAFEISDARQSARQFRSGALTAPTTTMLGRFGVPGATRPSAAMLVHIKYIYIYIVH